MIEEGNSKNQGASSLAVEPKGSLAIELRHLAKAFGDCVANSDVSLTARRGTIHAIVGENGAGKSTAMKMLYGQYRPDSGQILINGEERHWRSPRDAVAAGIGMVHQHFMLSGPETALDNVLLAAETSGPFRKLDRAGTLSKLRQLSADYGLEVDWEKRVEELPVGVQQRIEILKLLYLHAEILILDEPTAVLTPQETEDLFKQLRRLAKGEGGGVPRTILIITHKLKEVMSVSDDVSVFRAGRLVAERKTSETSIEELATLMVGRKVHLTIGGDDARPPAHVRGLGTTVLETRKLGFDGALEDVSFKVRAGEIVGIAGVEGNGQSQLLQALLRPRDWLPKLTGDIDVLGTRILGDRKALATREIKALGIGVIPEDRHREGLLLGRSVLDNFLLGFQRSREFGGAGGVLRSGALRAAASKAMEEYDVRPRALDTEIGKLSGGNQQKLIIAREMRGNPKLLIAAQPTRGVDVGAIESIHRRMIEARDRGAGVLLVSSELDEILALSDRILVFYRGKIAAELDREKTDEHEIGLYMGGSGISGARASGGTA